MNPFSNPSLFLALSVLLFGPIASGRINPGSTLSAGEDRAWVSGNGTFAFGFAPINSRNDRFKLGIWFARLPGDRTLVWSANINSPVTAAATLEFRSDGDLVLRDGPTTAWTSNTSNLGVQTAAVSETGNLVLYGPLPEALPVWQSFSHPSDTLLPGQPLTVSVELKSSGKNGFGFYTLKMLQTPTSLRLSLTYTLSGSNFSYWSGPDISNSTGEVVATLNSGGSFGISYGSSSGDGSVYVYKSSSDNDDDFPRRLTLETNGNLRLYRWAGGGDDVASEWVPEWAAVKTPCDIPGVCGPRGVCNLDASNRTNASCSGLPEGSIAGKCGPGRVEIVPVRQTSYYFSGASVIANYTDVETASECGDACLSDCGCVSSVYGLNEEKAYCWILRELEFGGYVDLGSTLFVKVNSKTGGRNEKVIIVLPVVLSVFIGVLLVCLLCIYVSKKRYLRREIENSSIVSGAPVKFSYRDLQYKTGNFSQLLGSGGFGRVYKGSLVDGSLVAVKKLDRVLPHGEKEFVTEVNTIGSMHHLNLVRLCGYCSERSQRLLVYEFMKNGSLDQWIFTSSCDRFLDWSSRFRVAIGTARGIAYFHEQCRDRVIHCDIKPENILLDESFCPKVSDFGLAKLMGREASRVFTMVRGTRGYLAPEWVSNRPITVKADVYSYGMLLLEIIGGRRNLDMSYGVDDFFYPGWAFKEMTRGSPMEAADRRLGGVVEEEELVRALKVAFWCIQDEIGMRPTMGEVVKVLEGSIEMTMAPMPQSVLELVEEGLENVYKAMKGEFNHSSSFTTITHPPSSSLATCSYSTMSPR